MKFAPFFLFWLGFSSVFPARLFFPLPSHLLYPVSDQDTNRNQDSRSIYLYVYTKFYFHLKKDTVDRSKRVAVDIVFVNVIKQ
jgi:hypothetical protein